MTPRGGCRATVRAALRTLAGGLLVGGLTGCSVLGWGDDDVDPESAEQALLEQRDLVGAEVRELLEGTEAVLGQQVLSAQGGWEGCESAFANEYRNFRYAAAVRLDVAPGSPERVAPELARIARDAGWEVEPGPRERPDEEVPDRAEKVRASRAGLTATLADLAPAIEGDVLLEVAADTCVDVPEDERGAWAERDDPGPLDD